MKHVIKNIRHVADTIFQYNLALQGRPALFRAFTGLLILLSIVCISWYFMRAL